MVGGYSLDTKKLSDKELSEYINYFRNSLSRSANPAGARVDESTLGQLQEEQAGRQRTAETDKGKQDLMSILGGTGGGGAGGGGFSISDYLAGQNESANAQRSAINSAADLVQGKQISDANDIFNAERRRAVDESGALGLTRQPSYLSSVIGDVDARRGKALSDILGTIGAQKFQSLAGVEQGLGDASQRAREFATSTDQSRRQSLAGLLQGGSQFQQNFGLQREQLAGEGRRNSLQGLMDQYGLDQAERLGKAQADAAKPTALDQFSKVTGGLGSLLGGIGSFRKPKIQTAGVYQ